MSSGFTGVIKGVVRDMREIGTPSFTQQLRVKIDGAPNYPPDSDNNDWHSGVIDGLSADYWLIQLSNASLAQGILDGEGGGRTRGLNAYLEKETIEARYQEPIAMPVPFCVGEWIAAYQEEGGRRALRALRDVKGFPAAFKDYLKKDSTIQAEIDTGREDESWCFPIYLRLAPNYLYYVPGDMLVYDDLVTVLPSFEILDKWSKSNWDDGNINDPDRTKELAVFFGRVSTIFFVPDNDTGLVQPSSAFATMEGFYSKAHGSGKGEKTPQSSRSPICAEAIRDAIDGLRPDEEVINGIKLWLETFVDNYKSLHQAKWKAALYRVSDDDIDSWVLACENFHLPMAWLT
ncbi:hypothetical protein BDV10DRAFT_190150 [Aspergillus recurvatus]